MRCLTLGWGGTSNALACIRQELEAHGHVSGSDAPDLWIEDGGHSLSSPGADVPWLSLRLGIGPLTDGGLPGLQLRAYERDQGLLATLDIADEPSGNGQQLRRRVTRTVVEWVALHVSGLSRGAGYFSAGAVANDWPEQGLHAIEALAFLHRFNRTADPALLLAAQVPVTERVQASLNAFASQPALDIGGCTFTYRQLQRQALAIQRRLQPLLASVERPVVGVCLDKSLGLYASILAVLGSGAVYLPLGPEQPPQRHGTLLDSAKACVLLDAGQHPLRGHLNSVDVTTVDCHDVDTTLPVMQHRPLLDTPCMLLFTSGTTGHPKGVLLSHGNLAHFTTWFSACVALDEQDRVLQFSSLGFDSSLIDIFPTLIAGAVLIVPSEEQRIDPGQLVALLHERRVTHAFLPPAVLSILPPDKPLGLKHLLTGGDVCEPHVIERLAAQCSLHNCYGPTETTVLITHKTLLPDDSNRNLGRPIANSQVLILDDNLQPVDEQVTGEVYIIGPGVSLGYVNDPQQTAAAFIQLAIPGELPLRAYRSGDLAKWTAEGIMLCGRRDDQVKIRGFRVEPGEIEHCLRSSRLYRQVAVVIDGNSKIGGFVAQPEPGASVGALKQYAQQRLADYMQPVLWRELAELPRTHSGKIDRRALLMQPVQPGAASTTCSVHSPLHRRLIGLWSELLELPSEGLSVDDSFFDLGGHSILLSTLLIRTREQFGRGFALNHFIEVPTVRTLGALLENTERVQATAGRATLDALRPLGLTLLPGDRAGDPRNVIVTGANSFVGVHIVEALLASGATRVACLVREASGLSAKARFSQALRDYRLEHLDLQRVEVFSADIGLPHLGLSDETHDYLAKDFGVLVHNAARVNHVMDYPSLARDNVEPIFECLRLCETHSKKVFNFISTLSASSSIDDMGHVLESPAAQTLPLYIKNGYNLSKWVGERLVGRAVEQGVWANIHRLGNISFNSRNGVCQPHQNRLMLMLKGSLQLGLLPRFELNFDLMPVDFLARLVVFHSASFNAERSVFNLHNPQPLTWAHYLDAFRLAGHRFEQVSVAQWQQALHSVSPDNALFGVIGFYLDRLDEDIGDTSMIRHDNARRGVEQMKAQYPEKNPALLSRGCAYLQSIGFI